MKYRKLRIAWSVGCGILCLLLIVLWVRSYWYYEAVWFTSTGNIVTGAAHEFGVVVFERLQLSPGVSPAGWHYTNYGSPSIPQPSWFKWESTAEYWLWCVPIWFLSVLSIAFGAIPWLRWRFSLRTLLIATTLL